MVRTSIGRKASSGLTETNHVERQVAALKTELQSIRSSKSANQIDLIETLRSETEIKKQLEAELISLRAKVEVDRKQMIACVAENRHLTNEIQMAKLVIFLLLDTTLVWPGDTHTRTAV